MTPADGRGWCPRGLCALLFVAIALTLFPRWAEPLTRPARWLMCLPLRALPEHTVAAAEATAAAFVADAALARLDTDALRGGAECMPAGTEPMVCRVLDRRSPGAAGLPTLLVLDRGWDEVADCTAVVTRGDGLVGFLGQPSDVDPLANDGHVVVRCVHASVRSERPRRLLAATTVGGVPLRVVVEPGSRIDAWPLRIPLLEDPYLVARLNGVGEAVHTCAAAVQGVDVPGELRIGTMRVWGYAEAGGPVLPVGFFVEPTFDPRAIATVVLWRHADRADTHTRREAAAPVARHAVRAVAFPPAEQRLYLVKSGGTLPVGAAVLARDGLLYGVVAEAGPGDAVADGFATVGRAWSLLLVADDGLRPPIECTGTVRAASAGRVELEMAAPVAAIAGEVVSAGNGLHCPAGLRVGRIAATSTDGLRLVVARPALDLSTVSVCERARRAP